jgi:hypothetical protein
VGSVEENDELWGFIKCGGCFDYLRKYLVLEIGCDMWS